MNLKRAFVYLSFFLCVASFCTAQTAVLAPLPRQCFVDSLSLGKPLASGLIYTCSAGTSCPGTPLATFTDSTGVIQNQNPIQLDGAGCAAIWLSTGLGYKFVAQNSLGVQEWSADNVTGLASTLTTSIASVTTVAFSATPTFASLAQNQLFKMTLTGNVTSSSLVMSGITPPGLVSFEITQDGTGGRTFVWPVTMFGAVAPSTCANCTTIENFLWDGATALLVSAYYNNSGIPILAGTSGQFANAGSFAGTTQVDYFQALINGCSPASLESGFGGPNPVFEEAIVGCAAVPSTATKVQVNGVAGLVTNSGTTTRTVGVFGLANALVANTAGVWGANFAVSSTVGFGGNPIYAAENDCNVGNTTDVCDGLLVAGNWTAQPTNSYGLLIAQPGPNSGTSGTNHWPNGLLINTGATIAPDSNHCGICFNPVGTGVNKQSQGMTFVANDPSSGQNVVTMAELPNGYFYISNTKAGTGLQVPNLLVTAGLSADGGGFKHIRGVTGCATAASTAATCDTTITWTTPFADANYTATCSGDGTVSGPPLSGGINSKLAASVKFRTVTATSAAAQFAAVECIAIHD